MNTRLLDYFVAAVEYGSFTQAAERLYTTQPNFSKQIAALERELGVTLFYREHRAIRLTPAGQVYFEQIRDVPQRLKTAARQALETERQAAGCVKIGILEGHQLRPELLEALDAFRRAHPDDSLVFSRGDFISLLDGLEQRQLDLVFTILFTMEQQPAIQSQVLYPQRNFVAVNRKNPVSSQSELTVSQLSGETIVLLDERCSPASYRQIQATLGQTPGNLVFVHSTEAIFTSVEANVGLAIVDGQNRLQTSASVKLIPLKGSAKNPDFGMAWRKGNEKQGLKEVLESIRRQGIGPAADRDSR